MNPPTSPIRTRAHVVYLIDRSGSMRQFGEEGYSSVQSAIEELPAVRGDDCLVSVITFDHKHTRVAQGALAAQYVLPEEAVAPRGLTALRDALKDTIEYMGTLPSHQKKFLVVFTDGQDNSSKTSTAQIKSMLSALDADISWLAAAEADMQTAEHLGIDEKDVMKVGCTGINMTQAIRSSSYKASTGFSQLQRRSSVE